MGGPDAVAGRPRETGSRNSRRRLRIVLGFSAAALAAIVYANGLAGPFVYDDHITVLHNPSLTDLSNTRFIAVYSLYRPFVNVSYALDRMIWGFVPFGFHLTNLALHIAVVLLFHRLCIRFLEDTAGDAGDVEWPAFFAAALYAVHPMMTEGVEYISGRSELLCAIGFLSALLFARDAVLTGSRAAVLAGIGAGIFAYGSKETAAALPVVLLASDAWIFGRDSWKRRVWTLYLPLFLATAAGALIRLRTLLRFEPEMHRSIHDNLLTQPIVLWRYLALMAMPAGQTIMHSVRFTTSIVDPYSWFSICAFAFLIGYAILERRKYPMAAVGLLWFLVGVVPSSILPLREGMAEHRVYVASGGLFLSLAAIFAKPLASSRTARAAAAILLAVCGWLTIQRNIVWRDPRRIWAEAVHHSPNTWPPHYGYADALREKGECDRAIPEYQTVLQLSPDHRDALTNLGICYAQTNQFGDAERTFTELITRYPEWSRGYSNFGTMEVARGNYERGRRFYLEAFKRNPQTVIARMGLADLDERVYHDYRSAAKLCDEVRGIDPTVAGAKECSERNWRKVSDGK
jgi:Tfp pilus assembly protein PilF